MARVTLGQVICEALGLTANDVTRLMFDIAPGDEIAVTVSFVPLDLKDKLREGLLLRDIEKVVKSYHLVENDE